MLYKDLKENFYFKPDPYFLITLGQKGLIQTIFFEARGGTSMYLL